MRLISEEITDAISIEVEDKCENPANNLDFLQHLYLKDEMNMIFHKMSEVSLKTKFELSRNIKNE